MDVHSPHIRPGPDVRRNTVFVPWDTPPSPKPGLVPHRKIWPAGEPFSHGGFFSAVENPPFGEKISWKRKSSIKNEKQTQGREEQSSSLPWVTCNDWMNASSIFFLLILLCKNGAKGYAKGYPPSTARSLFRLCAQYVGKSDAPKNHHDDPDEDSDGYIFQKP